MNQSGDTIGTVKEEVVEKERQPSVKIIEWKERETKMERIKKEAQTKERIRKKITDTQAWEECIVSHLSLSAQRHVLDELIRSSTSMSTLSPICKVLRQQIQIKQSSYRCQDTEKKILDESQLVQIEDILSLLQASNLQCFYCRQPVLLFYEYCRDPKQWTLERIDNSMGHNRGNVEIACLECNIRRRTMYYERYVMTKQSVFVKMDHEDHFDHFENTNTNRIKYQGEATRSKEPDNTWDRDPSTNK